MSDSHPSPDPDDVFPGLGRTTTGMTWEEIEEYNFHGSVEDRVPPYAVTGLVDPPGELPIPFDPVPRLRKRRIGWSEERQRAFIAALATCGCVSAAARSVGMSAKSAYRLLDAPGADSFAEAWDQAIAYGIDRLRGEAMDRAMNGFWVPVMRRGRIVRQEFRHNDRLAIALLSGRDHSIAERRERATSRRRHRAFKAAVRAEEEEKKRQADAIWAEHQAILDRIEAERSKPRVAHQPRIFRL